MEKKNALKPHQFIWMDKKVVIVLEDGKVLSPNVTPNGKIGLSIIENTKK